MTCNRTITLIVGAALAAPLLSFAAEGGNDWWEIRNRLRIEYDDNIYERADNTTDSFKIIEELEFHANLQLTPQTFFGLRYRPSFTYWTDREPDDTDLHHDLDVVLNHRFSPTTTLGFKNQFRIAEQAEQIEDGVQIREQDDYTMNVTDLNLQHGLSRTLFTRIGGRYKLLEYDRDDVAATDNYDQFSGGISIGYKVSPDMNVLGEYRYQQTDYDYSGEPSRDSESQFAGINIEQTFSPNLIGSLRAGIQSKSFDADSIDDEENPYFDIKVTAIPSPDTRLSLGAGYSMFEADVFPYTSQDRTLAFLSVAHDLSARISLYLTGSY
jgi:hypothetical protein